jgi:hypothetical protein
VGSGPGNQFIEKLGGNPPVKQHDLGITIAKIHSPRVHSVPVTSHPQAECLDDCLHFPGIRNRPGQGENYSEPRSLRLMPDRGVKNGCVSTDDWIFQRFGDAWSVLDVQRGDILP